MLIPWHAAYRRLYESSETAPIYMSAVSRATKCTDASEASVSPDCHI